MALDFDGKQKSINIIINIIFISSVLFLVYASLSLVINLPFGRPHGGPDEPMHISMSEYIAEYLTWPSWDSPELLRYINGTSYATISSIVYWLHAILYKVFGLHRLGSFILFIVFLSIITYYFRKNKVAGITGAAFITPQVVFIFSYVNSDVGTIIVAFLFGIAMANYINKPNDKLTLFFFFAMAGACLTAKQHMWIIGFVAFLYVLWVKRKSILHVPAKYIIIAILLAFIIASWWPVTSYFAHDGDLIGRVAAKKAKLLFGDPNTPSLAVDWGHFNLIHFFSFTIMSFYGIWGWMNVKLPLSIYILTIPLFLFFSIFLIVILLPQKKFILFFIGLLSFNFLLMVIYSIYYDYQAQGRYMFPSFFIILGIILKNIVSDKCFKKNYLLCLFISTLSIILILLNIYNIILLENLILIKP